MLRCQFDSFVETQGFGGGPKNHNGLDIVPYLEWDEELGKPSVLHLPVPHSWPFIDPEFRSLSFCMSKGNVGGDFTMLICFLVFMGFMIFADIDTQRKCPKKKTQKPKTTQQGSWYL